MVLEGPQLHQEDVDSVVGSVFSTMMGLEVWRSDDPCPPTPGLLTGAVYLTGSWEGAVCIHCGPAQACAFAGRFVGTEPPERVDDDVRDVIGELANMIGGNLKCTLCPGIRVSIPSVTDGASYTLRVCGARTICRMAFQTEAGPVWITVSDSAESR